MSQRAKQEERTVASQIASKSQLTPDLYREIFIHSREAIAIISPEGRYLEQNGAHYKLLGYSDDELQGQTPAIHLGDEVFAKIAAELIETGTYHGEVVSRTRDGKERHVDLSAFAMRNSVGEPVCYVGIKRDITESRRVQQRLALLLESEQAARSEAEKANRLKDEFLATLSHELRTPLNAVIGWSRMLKSGRLDSRSSRHALEVIERNAWAQQQIIEDILDVSRVVTGKLQLHPGPVKINSVIDAALDAMRPALQAKEISVESDIPDDLEVISGDADRLQQVVWNLVSNAAKYTSNGGQVEIRVRQDESQMHIIVTDSGTGIQPEFLPHVFERFRQADGSTTRTHGGLGLGLAIVRHLVELHGGTISARNRTDGTTGAIFEVSLPLPATKLLPDSDLEGFVYQEPHYGPTTLEGLRVLVVDDDLDTLDLITIELAQHGAVVRAVSSGAKALDVFDQSPFDVLVADIGMPEMDGYELIRRIRKRESGKDAHIPAVALTAYARVQDRMRAVIAGYNTHAAKPLEAKELLTVVASLAGRL